MSDVKAFMKLIRAMESSGGKDTRHPALESGIHEGDAAIGEYALMPNTVKELARQKQVGPSDDVIAGLPNDSVSNLLKENPELAQEYVRRLSEKLMDKAKGDPNLGMVGWRYGHNLPIEELKNKAKENPEYVQKVDQRIGEEHLQSSMPNLMDMLKVPYKDIPQSKQRK